MSAKSAKAMVSSQKERTTQKRAFALDALRGYAILTMILSGIVPREGIPRWMYHAQVPPPDFTFNPNLPGITWVDLIFPFFIFAMGAAFPLALSRKIEQKQSYWKLGLSSLFRGLLLCGFAIYLEHIRPYVMSESPNTIIWLKAILGFAFLFPIFVRLPESWKLWVRIAVKSAGWIGAILLMWTIREADGSGFSLGRNDIILLVLANLAFFGSLIWLATQKNTVFRLGFMGIMAALMLSYVDPNGWVRAVYDFKPVPGLYNLYFLKYLHVLIPGMIVGDMILNWMKTPEIQLENLKSWSRARYSIIIILMLSFFPLMLIGLFTRWVTGTVIVSLVLCAAGSYLFKNPVTSTEKLLKDLFSWGVFWLILGLVFEPYEGGIKKDHSTMSYYFVTSGLAIFMLISLTVWIDVFKKKRSVQFLIDNGQNPMIGYCALGNFVMPILAVIGVGGLVNQWIGGIADVSVRGWVGFGWSVVMTILVGLFARECTRRRIFWRT
jgi:predicted acyltransferase